MKLAKTAVLAALAASGASAQTNLGAQIAVRHDPGGNLRSAVAAGVPAGRADADHREGWSHLAGNSDQTQRARVARFRFRWGGDDQLFALVP